MATSIDSMAEKIFSINDTLSHQVCLGYKFGLQVYLRYSTNIKKVLTSESKRRADLKILNIRMAQQTRTCWWTERPLRCATILSALVAVEGNAKANLEEQATRLRC